MAPFSQFSFMQATEKRAALGVESRCVCHRGFSECVKEAGAELMN